MKIKILVTLMLLMSVVTIVSPVAAKGPTKAGGIKPVEEWGIPWAPYNDNAWWHSGQSISPSIFGVGTPTTIIENGITITVSAIPEATFNPLTEEWEGTHLMYKASNAWLENPYQETAWVSLNFWLNEAGPVTITYDDGVTQITEIATEFIFFLVRYVGLGMGNSDYDASGSFDIIIQAYN